MTPAIAPERRAVSVGRYDHGDARWNRFVAGFADSTYCHLAQWREVMADALGQEPVYLAATDAAGEMAGALPLVRVRSRIFGHYLVSMPFINYGGPLAAERGVSDALAAAATGLARASGADLLELRTHRDPPRGLRVCERKVTVRLPLPASADALWNGVFRAKLRSQIRRPQKEGMTFRAGRDGLVGPFYEVFSRNMRDLGTPVLPRAFFERVAKAFPGECLFGVVEHAGRPVAAGCGFLWNGSFEITWASSLREYNPSAPNMLLYWGLMETVIARGATVFDFGRCSPGGSTHRFKLQWGGREEPLPWAQWSPRAVEATPSPDRGVYRHAVRAWQRLPVPVANRLGPFFARRIP